MISKGKRPRDPNQLAHMIVQMTTGQVEPESKLAPAEQVGRPGGLKGGKARAAKLSPEKRAEIAQKAAAARWKPKN